MSGVPSFITSAASRARKRPGSQKSLLRSQPPNNVGSHGEDIAVSYLLKKRFRIVARNFRARYGEIDIIAADGDTLVFVEVKTRTSDRYGMPAEGITPRKLREVIRTAQVYLSHLSGDKPPYRIDAVAVLLDTTGSTRSVEHFRSITSGLPA